MWKNLLKLEMNISFNPEIPYLRNYFIDILIDIYMRLFV